MVSVILGKGKGSNSVWLGRKERGRKKVWLDFTYPIFAVLIGRKRSFKSSLLRVLVEGLLDRDNGLSQGFLPKPIIFDPIGNLPLDRSNPEAREVPELSFNNIKTLNIGDGSLKIPFSSLKADDISAFLGINKRCVLQRKVIRMITDKLGEGTTKDEFVAVARVHAFKLPHISQEGFETKIDALESDPIIADDVPNPIDYLMENRGIRIDLSALLPSDRARASFFCSYILEQLVEMRKRAREEEIKFGLGEPAKPILEPACVIVDELNRLNPKSLFNLVRISGNLGVSVVLASQSIRDFRNPILGERDVTFCGKLVSKDEVRKASALIPAALTINLGSDLPRLEARSCIAWNEHNSITCKLRLRDSATLHIGRDDSVERFKGLYEGTSRDVGTNLRRQSQES